MQTFISVPFEKAENKREIKRLYRTAFPRAERTAFYKILRACKRGGCTLSAYFENGAFAGVSVALERETFVYLFFLAVKEDARGKGIGGRILNAVAERYAGKTWRSTSKRSMKKLPTLRSACGERNFICGTDTAL